MSFHTLKIISCGKTPVVVNRRIVILVSPSNLYSVLQTLLLQDTDTFHIKLENNKWIALSLSCVLSWCALATPRSSQQESQNNKLPTKDSNLLSPSATDDMITEFLTNIMRETPFLKHAFHSHPYTLGYLFGNYLSSGTITKDAVVYHHSQYSEIIMSHLAITNLDVKLFMSHDFTHSSESGKDNLLPPRHIHVLNKEYRSFIVNQCGYGKNKRMPDFTHVIDSTEFFRGLVCGYINAINVLVYTSDRIEIRSLSSTILRQLHDVLVNTFGIACGYNASDPVYDSIVIDNRNSTGKSHKTIFGLQTTDKPRFEMLFIHTAQIVDTVK